MRVSFEKSPELTIVIVMNQWTTQIGDTGTRDRFKELYGGETNSGIQTPRTSNNILCYTDPAVGERFGYRLDGWNDDRTIFHYTGQGAYGDQVLPGKNRCLAERGSNGTPVRLFHAVGTVPGEDTRIHEYIGEFEVNKEEPYRVLTALDGNQKWRRVYLFNLIPVDAEFREGQPVSRKPDLPQRVGTYESVPLANHASTNYEVPPVDARTAEKREETLVGSFTTYLRAKSIEPYRMKIVPYGATSPLFTDICDPHNSVLYEAKAGVARQFVRDALGQLLDYRRYLTADFACSALFPGEPSADLVELLHSYSISVAYPSNGGFVCRKHDDPNVEKTI